MNIIYFNSYSGISGDMVLGSLLDLLNDDNAFIKKLSELNISDYKISVNDVKKQGIKGKSVDVTVLHHVHGRHFKNIQDLILNSNLSQKVKQLSIDIFYEIAKAEATVHGETIEHVHFHEVGAVDSIVDIVGCAVLLEMLNVDEVYFSELTDGVGFVDCQHGKIPTPVPAVLEMLKESNIPFKTDSSVKTELVTPTGMSIAKTLGKGFGEMPEMEVIGVGYGFGTREIGRLNALTAILGVSRKVTLSPPEEITVLETNIDDSNPEYIGYTMERLLQNGAFDAYLTPIYMKKNRPGFILSCIVPFGKEEPFIRLILENTSTLGIRILQTKRVCMHRESFIVETKYGKISVTKAVYDDIQKFNPEFEDCKDAALLNNVSIKDIYEAVYAQVPRG